MKACDVLDQITKPNRFQHVRLHTVHDWIHGLLDGCEDWNGYFSNRHSAEQAEIHLHRTTISLMYGFRSSGKTIQEKLLPTLARAVGSPWAWCEPGMVSSFICRPVLSELKVTRVLRFRLFFPFITWLLIVLRLSGPGLPDESAAMNNGDESVGIGDVMADQHLSSFSAGNDRNVEVDVGTL